MNFGIELINGVIEENPEVWTPEFQGYVIERIKKAVELECQYAQECLPRGVLGLNVPLLREYVQYIADRRFERLHLPKQYGSNNPFPWMSEVIDLKKEKNFFESRVTEYQTGGALEWQKIRNAFQRYQKSPTDRSLIKDISEDKLEIALIELSPDKVHPYYNTMEMRLTELKDARKYKTEKKA